MSLSIANRDYSKSIQVFGSIVSNENNKMIVIIDTPQDAESLDFFDHDNLVVQTLDNNYETVDHQISNHETKAGISENQWFIEFTLK